MMRCSSCGIFLGSVRSAMTKRHTRENRDGLGETLAGGLVEIKQDRYEIVLPQLEAQPIEEGFSFRRDRE